MDKSRNIPNNLSIPAPQRSVAKPEWVGMSEDEYNKWKQQINKGKEISRKITALICVLTIAIIILNTLISKSLSYSDKKTLIFFTIFVTPCCFPLLIMPIVFLNYLIRIVFVVNYLQISNKYPTYEQLNKIKKYEELKVAYDEMLREMAAEEERKRREFWIKMDAREFEYEIASLYSVMGYKVDVTPCTGDGGVDIWLEKDGNKIAVQCKRYSGAVGPSVVRSLYGVMVHTNASQGIVVTTGTFTDGAYRFAQLKPIKLVDIDGILDMEKNRCNKGINIRTMRKMLYNIND